jgi:hypothetical protein
MAISFPSNPTVGEQYTAASITWEWNGSSWESLPPSPGIGLTNLSVTQSAVGTAALSYNNSSGAFSYTPPDLSSYLTSYTETDTLSSVTGRGAITNTNLTFGGGLNVSGISTFSGNVNLSQANVVLGVSTGSSDDRLKFHTSEIYQDTLAFRIISNTGGINLRGGSTNSWTNASGAEEYITATENGSVDLYYDNSKKLETTTSGVKITGESKSDSITLEGRSFSILPSGSQDVTFQNTFTGGKIVQRAAGDVEIQGYQGSTLLKTNTGAALTGGIKLYYANGLTTEVERLTTTSNGVDINGNLNVSSNITVGSGQSFGSSTGSAAVYYGDGSNLTGVGGGLSSRSVVSATTGSVSVGATTNLDITGFKSYGLLKVGISSAAWVRLYVDASSRTSDSSRSYLTDPTPGSGLIAEVRTVTAGISTFLMTPGVIGYNNDASVGSTIYTAVTNNESSSSTITVDLTVLKMEN